MTSIKKEIMEEFEKLWRKEIKLAGHDNTNPLYKLTNGLGAFESFLSQALTRIEEAAKSTPVEVDYKCHCGLVNTVKMRIYKPKFMKGKITEITVNGKSISPSEEKELGNHTKECSFIKYDTGICDCSKKE